MICSWGRLGHWFGCERYGYVPNIITTAKGLTSAYAPMGAVIAGQPSPKGSVFRDKGLPIVGDDIKSQVGATIVHRQLARLFGEAPAYR